MQVTCKQRPPSIVLQLESMPFPQPGATLTGTPSPAAFLPPSPLLRSSVCQAQLVNRSQSRSTSCFQHMGAWRRGSYRAALQTRDAGLELSGDQQVISSRKRNREELLFSAKDAICCLPQSFALFEGVGGNAESCRFTLWAISYSFIWTWDIPHRAEASVYVKAFRQC